MSAVPAARSCSVRDVPVLRVARRGDRHHVHDMRIDVQLQLAAGGDAWPDTRAVVRAIHALAAEHGASGPEPYALAIGRHCTRRLDGVVSAEVEVRRRAWGRLDLGGRPRERDLLGATAEQRIARVVADAGGERVLAGLSDLVLLSSYAAADARVTVRRLRAVWTYGWVDVPYDTQWQQVRRALTEAFAEREDEAAGLLAAAMARAALAETPALASITVSLESVGRIPIDMTDVGLENAGDVFGGPTPARSVHEVSLARLEIG